MAKDKDKSTARAETQGKRRFKYGVNVTVAVLAAIALAVLVNWIAYRQYIHFDLTATRRYSLSAQTQKVLGQLDHNYKIVAFFREDTIPKQRVADLIDQYGRYSGHLKIEHLNPDRDYARSEKFLRTLQSRFADDLKPTIDAIHKGQKTLKEVGPKMAQVLKPLDQLSQSGPLPKNGKLKQFIETVRAALTRTQDQLSQQSEAVKKELDRPLPDYTKASDSLHALLSQLKDNVLAVIVKRFNQAADDDSVPAAVRDHLLGLVKQLKPISDRISKTLDALEGVKPVQRYDQMRTKLANSESVVLVSPKQVRVLDVNNMYRQLSRQVVERTGGSAKVQFLGEEQLTGALISMSIKQPAMVVFITTGRQPALGPRGQYQEVAKRLRTANFRVEQWNPTGQFTAMGQRTPPQPPPQPKPGQKTIWIVLPSPPMNPMMAAGTGNTQIASVLKDRLAKGDAAMILLAASPTAGFGGTNAVADLVKKNWGIAPELDRVIFQQMQGPNHQTQSRSQFAVHEWPDSLPITKALGGMAGVFLLPSPLVVDKSVKDVTTWPLIKLSADRMWAQRDFGSIHSAADIKYNAAQSAKSYVIAAAAQKKNGQRLIVTTAGGVGQFPGWAGDQITTLSTIGLRGSQWVDAAGAAFPANSELFVNGVYWLAGLDQMIAASPRTQDIRRIQPIETSSLYAYRAGLLAGIPLVVLASGLGVWVVRRRG